jgi:hypothetical protein
MFSMAGLAYAGVSLPAPAVTAFERAGITLPNQSGGPSTSDSASNDHGKDVSGIAKDHSTTGCEHGRAVSKVASHKRQDVNHAPNRQNSAPDPCNHTNKAGTGVESPAGNQGQAGTSATQPSNHGQDVKKVATDGSKGCEHGQDVSSTARDNGNGTKGNGPDCTAGNSGAVHGGGPSNNTTGNHPGH